MMAKKTAVPDKTPPVASGGKSQKNKFDQAVYQQNLFLAMAFSMSWQLAIAVIVPIVGGYKLDQHMDSSPLYTIIGLIVAIFASGAILYRVLAEAQKRTTHVRDDKK
jgi:F0F1-type ATP synthase assembly protein I